MRARFTIADSAWGRAQAYAEATNRTPSELICEALDQIQARYPKTPRCNGTCEERVIARILADLASQVPAGTFAGEKSGQEGRAS
jgi:hypothetical protein